MSDRWPEPATGEQPAGTAGGAAAGFQTDILLISTGRAEEVRDSLPRAMAQPGARVTVIDNGCTDETAELAEQVGANVLRLPEPLSWCAANNAAIAATEADEVMLLNADCFLTASCLERMRPALWRDRVGSVAPKLTRAAGPDQPLGEIDTAALILDRRRKNNLVGHGDHAARYSTPGPCFGADGAAVLYRREMLTDCAVGGAALDEDFEKYAADVDLSWRAQLLGWSCAYEPSALAFHIRTYSPSTRANVSAAERRMQFRNRYLMMLKNQPVRGIGRDLPVILAFEALALGHALLRERELLGGYFEALRRAPGALRQRRAIQARRRVDAVPFGLAPRP